ncbi:MAG: hypothetical protein HFJ95_03050 [Muribaculaceae bacterium]|jgi:hypothetical protein|nr:hypothetical protein [Muribaculaceae bacterium]
MEFYNGIFTPVHEEFFGSIVGAQNATVKTTASQDYVTEWSMPTSNN